jgi:predicted transcriptional regulator
LRDERRLRPQVIPVILAAMKTAISLPDDLFDAINARAKTLRISRSALLANAARAFLDDGKQELDATQAWNLAIDEGGQPGDDRAAVAAQKRTKAVVRATHAPARKKRK